VLSNAVPFNFIPNVVVAEVIASAISQEEIIFDLPLNSIASF